MNDAINFEARNDLTEYQNNYRLINCPLLCCYIGLEGKLNQLSIYLFLKILDKKLYGEKAKTKSNEEKRIYTDSEITIEDILRDINPKKYKNNEKALLSDQANLGRRINELDKRNIFYYWRYKKYYTFVMERDVGCWKCRNPKGYVSPKTLKKIVALSGDMISHIIGVVKRNGLLDTEEDIILSYGKFLRRMISKMNPRVSHTLPIWTSESLGEYLKKLGSALSKINEHSGVTQDEGFMDNLPPTVSKKLKKYIERTTEKHSKYTEDSMIKKIEKVSSFESELIPKDQNIARKRRERKPKANFEMSNEMPEPSEPSEPKMYRYDEDVDPFKDAKEFMRYYRAFLTMKFMKSVKFDGFQNDAPYAAQILDLLIAHKRNDKIFLNGWLSHFCEQKLKGAKAFKTQYTSMKTLKDTFVEFNPLFPYIEA